MCPGVNTESSGVVALSHHSILKSAEMCRGGVFQDGVPEPGSRLDIAAWTHCRPPMLRHAQRCCEYSRTIIVKAAGEGDARGRRGVGDECCTAPAGPADTPFLHYYTWPCSRSDQACVRRQHQLTAGPWRRSTGLPVRQRLERHVGLL